MKNTIRLEELKNIIIEEASGDQKPIDKSSCRNYTKDIATMIVYLLGIKDDSAAKRLGTIEEYTKIKEKLEKDRNAIAIHHLNNIRSNLMLKFKDVSRSLRNISADYKPLYEMDDFKDDFRVLKELDISIITGRWDIYEYLKRINDEISKRIDNLSYLFPKWIKFRNIRSLFVMPKNIEEETKKFQANQSIYPFQRYLFWKNPIGSGYILSDDISILEIAYSNNGEVFEDYSKVADASDMTKTNIGEFISSGSHVQIFIDGENADPYKFVSAIYSLAAYEVDKIKKITVYYDEHYTTKAWSYMEHFIKIPFEAVPVERISGNKSLVDHTLIAGVSQAVYREQADRIILVSSDSDFWSVIKFVSDAKFMVMIESEKCGQNFKNALRSNNVFYCYLDRFITVENNTFFKMIFRHELSKVIKERFRFGNAKEIFDTAVRQSRAEVSQSEQESIFKEYMKGLKLVIDKNGDFQIEIPD